MLLMLNGKLNCNLLLELDGKWYGDMEYVLLWNLIEMKFIKIW